MALSPRDKQALRVVANTIVAERNRRRWSQDDLADASEVSLSTIQRMEQGDVDCGLSKYVRVARSMELRPSLILDELGAT